MMSNIIKIEKTVYRLQSLTKDPVMEMIAYIKRIYDNNDDVLKNIADVNLLYDALYDLHEIIGMPKVKDSIAKLLKLLLIEKKTEGNKFDNHMMHTVIYGPPGVGKTLVGSVLAKIWVSLGIIKKRETKTELRRHISPSIPNIGSERKRSSLFPDINRRMTDKSLPQYSYCKSTISVINKYTPKIEKRSPSPCRLPRIDKLTPQHSAPQPAKAKLLRIRHNAPILIVSRADFVAPYVGQTAEKTRKLLVDTLNQGKSLFIDEAYSLINDERDSFGYEALHELNRFMSEHPELVIIFAGYRKEIANTIFKAQPGFKRRCTWIFEIDNYTSDMLALIFRKQLSTNGWYYGDRDDHLSDFFKHHMSHFPAFGGDTLRLVLHCKLRYAELKFDKESIRGSQPERKLITLPIIKDAFEQYTHNFCL